MEDPLSIFVPANRKKLLVTAGVFGSGCPGRLVDEFLYLVRLSISVSNHDCSRVPVAQSHYHHRLAVRFS